MIKVLFVCLGNICRSPTAEGVFRNLVKREGLSEKIKVDSAGVGKWHVGEPPDRRPLRCDAREHCGLLHQVHRRQVLLSSAEQDHELQAIARRLMLDVVHVQVHTMLLTPLHLHVRTIAHMIGPVVGPRGGVEFIHTHTLSTAIHMLSHSRSLVRATYARR